jgi:very-short-patch-repair endonuclease
MIFISISGKQQKVRNPTKYLIKWEKKCRSKIQKNVKDFLKEYWFSDVVFEEFPVLGSRMTFDFYNANKKIAIEVDGEQHYKYNKFFHGNDRHKFLQQLKRDQKKEDFCEINKIKLVRIVESDILNEDLLEKLEII